jgi:hypothetical protein
MYAEPLQQFVLSSATLLPLLIPCYHTHAHSSGVWLARSPAHPRLCHLLRGHPRRPAVSSSIAASAPRTTHMLTHQHTHTHMLARARACMHACFVSPS